MMLRACLGLIVVAAETLAFHPAPALLPLRSRTPCSPSQRHCEALPVLGGARPTVSLRAKDKGGLWTPEEKPAELWTPQGVVQVQDEPQDEMARPLLDSEWEIMLAASEDLRELAKSGQLMEELVSSGEDLGGVDVTEIGKRPTGDAVDLDEVFAKWKEFLGSGDFKPSMAPLTSQMISACMRKGPKSWLESLGALQVLGFDPDSFVAVQGKTKVVDLDAMALYFAGTLMGIDLGSIKKDAGALSAEVRGQVQDLAVSAARVMLRYALLEDVLKRQPNTGGVSLAVVSRAVPAALETEGVLLPENAAANIMMSDFDPPFELEEGKATVGGAQVEAFVVGSQQVDSWLAAQLGVA